MKNHKQLNFEDLVKIETLMEEDFKPTEIAIKLSRDKSCVYFIALIQLHLMVGEA